MSRSFYSRPFTTEGTWCARGFFIPIENGGYGEMSRRYVVKMVTSWSGWTGTVWAYGCKHLASAEALFARREVEVSPGDYSALLLIDRQEHQILRSKGTKDPVKTAGLFGW
jgi:hypothetical protein